MDRRSKIGLSLGKGIECRHHVRGRQIGGILDVSVLTLVEEGAGEGHPEIALLYLVVDDRNDFGTRRIGQDGAIAQRTGTEFHAPLATGHDLAIAQHLGGFQIDIFRLANIARVGKAKVTDGGFNLIGYEIGTQVEVGEREGRLSGEHLVPVVSGADGGGLIAGAGTDAEVLQTGQVFKDHVRLHVHEHATRGEQIHGPGRLQRVLRKLSHQIFAVLLGRAGDPVESLPMERSFKTVSGGAGGGRSAKLHSIDLKQVLEYRQDSLDPLLVRVGSQTHDFVLVFARLHPHRAGDQRVEDSEGVQIRSLSEALQRTVLCH